VIDVLEADVAAATPRRLPPVIVGTGGRVPVGADVAHTELRLADGTIIDLDVDDDHVEVDDPLPVGCHTLSLGGRDLEESTTIVTPPPAMPTSPALAGRAALFVPAYALWESDAPLPSFTHLAALGAALPALDVDALITLPLYAGFLDEPFDPSPYAPVSRLHWNEVYLDDGDLPAAAVPPSGDLVDWRLLASRRRGQLLEAAAEAPAEVTAAADRFVGDHPDIGAYARFRATVAVDAVDAGRPAPLVEASHRLAQYLAHLALSRLHDSGGAAFALDLPIGSHPLGYETWAHPELFAPAMAVGAPPDKMFPGGQNWGFPPQLPGAAERSGFALWRAIVRRCGTYASLLRIDHVLGVHRLWWIPDGMDPLDGVYVRYPRDTLMAVIAAEAAGAGTTVVGEDLGTVPEEITAAMEQWTMLGLYAEQTMLADPELPAIPARKVAGMRTHDMEPFAQLFERGDLDGYAAKLARDLDRPVANRRSAMLDAAHERLARSAAYLVFADLDDLLGETEPHNVPGSVSPAFWRRRLRRPASETLADPDVRRQLAILTCRQDPGGEGRR
jgi:4-alpha-glucanotransferase